jgi:hypothetical protein
MAKRPTKVAHRAAKPAHSANVAHSGEGDTDPASTKVERRVPTPEREREAGTADTAQEAQPSPPSHIPVEGDILPPEKPNTRRRKDTGRGKAKGKRGQTLTVKQAKLVANLIVHNGNKTQAALAAGYGSNPNSAASIAHETLQIPKVAEAYRLLRLRLSERLEISADVVAQRLMHAAERANVEGDLGAEIRALSQLAKITGASTERKVNLNIKGGLAEYQSLMARVRSR